MTPEAIRQKARELHARTRRKLLGALAGPLAAAFFYVSSLKQFPAQRHMLQPLFGFALAWSLAGVYFVNRRMWSAAAPGDAGSSTGLEYCRAEIERHHRILRRLLFWTFGPILFAISCFIGVLGIVVGGGRGLFPKALPFMTLVVVWIIAFFVIRFQEQQQLRRELDQLNEVERQNRR